jgi:hypothetical protein
MQMNRYGLDGAREAARGLGVPEERIREVDAELRVDGLVDDGGPTTRGTAYADRLVSARRELLSELLDDPDAERRPEVERLMRALARDTVGERP